MKSLFVVSCLFLCEGDHQRFSVQTMKVSARKKNTMKSALRLIDDHEFSGQNFVGFKDLKIVQTA